MSWEFVRCFTEARFGGTILINLSFNIRENSWSALQWVYTAVFSAG